MEDKKLNEIVYLIKEILGIIVILDLENMV